MSDYGVQEDPYWNQTQLSDFEAVLDEFQQYDNTAGVFVGNEVIDLGRANVACIDLWLT